MSLDKIEEHLNEIGKLSEDYDELLNERKKLEKKISKLKEEYGKEEFEKDVFSKHNKRIVELNKNLQRIKEKVYDLSVDIKEEIKNAG